MTITTQRPGLLQRLTSHLRQMLAELDPTDEAAAVDASTESVAQETVDKAAEPVNRDTAIGSIWEQVANHFWAMNRESDRSGDFNNSHYMQDLYTGSNGGMFAITTNQGRLFRSPVFVNDGGVTVGEPVPVSVSFTPQQRTRAIARTEDGRPIFLSILGAATINKDGEIDSRALFDTFVERFKGDGSEYVNLYHLGKDKSRIGAYSWIGRDNYLLLGAWSPDDTPLARAVANTLENDTEGEWGNSIEFLPDDEGALVEIAPDIEVRAFDAGTFIGCSIVLANDACHWFTTNRPLSKERMMNNHVRAAVLKAVGGEEVLIKPFEEDVDTANRMIAESGAVTRTAEATEEPAAELTATQDDTANTGMADVLAAITELKGQIAIIQAANAQERTIELTPEAAQGIATVIFTGAEFTQLANSVAAISGALEQQAKQAADQAQALTERIAKLEKQATERIAALERTDEQKFLANEELKPRSSSTIISWRAPRGEDDKSAPVKIRSIADEADALAQDMDKAWG